MAGSELLDDRFVQYNTHVYYCAIYCPKMSNGHLQVIQNVSSNLRLARQQQGWSQEKLAAEAGVSRRMLVNIEAGGSNVSIATVDRLANALGLTFSEVVHPPQRGKSQRSAPVLIWQGEHPDSRASLLESIPQPGQVVELWHWQLAPGDQYRAEPDAPGCHEMLYVYEGQLTVVLEGKPQVVNCGQSFAFASDVDYCYRSTGEGLVRFAKTIIMVMPGSGGVLGCAEEPPENTKSVKADKIAP